MKLRSNNKMKMKSALVSLFCVFSLLYVGIALAETQYAKRNNVKVTQEKSPFSKVVVKLKKGDAVEIQETSGRHAKVQTSSGKVGWVFVFKLTDKEPAKSSKGSGQTLGMITGESQVFAQESQSGGSIRGLKATSNTYAQSKNISKKHREAVDRMEAFKVSDKELLKFQEQGGTGEFGGDA